MKVLFSYFLAFQFQVYFFSTMAPTPLPYIGIGYDILQGNPDAWDWSKLGQDPGLLITRNILQTSVDGTLFVKQVPYPHCTPTTSSSVFYDPKSYQDYLKNYIKFPRSSRNEVSDYAFTKNQLYLDIKSKTLLRHEVFRDEVSICLSDRARFAITQLLNINLITFEFAVDACNLPNEYEPIAYRNFLHDWGTHITMEVDLGQRNVTRYHLSETDLAEFILKTHKSDAADLKLEAFEGYGSVVELNMSHILHSDFFNLNLGTNYLDHGTTVDIPIAWSLKPISEVFKPLYWRNENELISSGICNSFTATNLSVWKSNVETALKEYPLAERGEMPQKSNIKLPVTWPSGTYGLLMTTSGCPNDPVSFETGYLLQDAEDDNNRNSHSQSLHINGSVGDNFIVTRFCMKRLETTTDYSHEWPQGDYCIFKKNACPNGFTSGFLYFDDEDSYNRNTHSGVLPDGTYIQDTKIEFCCRHDGLSNTPILLPIDKPFYLFRYHDHCQQVLGMEVTDEYIHFDTEDDTNRDGCGGTHPDVGAGCRDFSLHCCYYSLKGHSLIDIPAALGKR